MVSLLVIIAGYLIGSIPTAYIAARFLKRIDLRQYGSGTVSGSMVYEHVGRLVVVPVGLFDIAKGAFPTWLALQLGLGETSAALAGLAAVLGHNWPIYLGFTGGRGLSPFLGVMLILTPWACLWLLGFLAVGFFIGDSAPFALASLLTLPLLLYYLDSPPASYAATVGMVLITTAKRLEANRRPLPDNPPEKFRVLLRRLVYDRDIRDHRAWINRKPDS